MDEPPASGLLSGLLYSVYTRKFLDCFPNYSPDRSAGSDGFSNVGRLDRSSEDKAHDANLIGV